MRRRLNCLFIVQGEGRGHVTQALALSRILTDSGHSVSAVLLGSCKRRNPPQFFLEKIGVPVHRFSSPCFATDDRNRSICMSRTLANLVRHLGKYRKSFHTIGEHIRRYDPDVVVNFYEPLTGLYYKLHRPDVPMVCIAHQYLVHHERYPDPPGNVAKRLGLKVFTDITSLGAVRRLALSFYPTSDIPFRKTTVVPPLLRAGVFELGGISSEAFLLAYILNSGYAEQIICWHQTRPETILHCFWDNPKAPEVYRAAPNLTFHQIDDQKFLAMMRRCRGLICTAGFESVCEAMYLGKPVMMVPVEGHIEQACNALDGAAAGAGIARDTFDIDTFLEFLSNEVPPTTDFCAWADSAANVVLRQLEIAAERVSASDAPVVYRSARRPVPEHTFMHDA